MSIESFPTPCPTPTPEIIVISVEDLQIMHNFISVEQYLSDIQLQCLNNAVGVNAIPTGAHIRDDEQVRVSLLNFFQLCVVFLRSFVKQLMVQKSFKKKLYLFS